MTVCSKLSGLITFFSAQIINPMWGCIKDSFRNTRSQKIYITHGPFWRSLLKDVKDSTKSEEGEKTRRSVIQGIGCTTGERRREVSRKQLSHRPKRNGPDGKGGWEGFKRGSPEKQKSWQMAKLPLITRKILFWRIFQCYRQGWKRGWQ